MLNLLKLLLILICLFAHAGPVAAGDVANNTVGIPHAAPVPTGMKSETAVSRESYYIGAGYTPAKVKTIFLQVDIPPGSEAYVSDRELPAKLGWLVKTTLGNNQKLNVVSSKDARQYFEKLPVTVKIVEAKAREAAFSSYVQNNFDGRLYVNIYSCYQDKLSNVILTYKFYDNKLGNYPVIYYDVQRLRDTQGKEIVLKNLNAEFVKKYQQAVVRYGKLDG